MPRNNRIYLSVPHASGGELALIDEAFRSNWLSTVGPHITELERQFSLNLGCPCVALGSGTAGLHLGTKLLGVRSGDEVITPTLTFAASCNPLLYESAKPILIDSDYASWNIDPNRLDGFLKKRARVNRLPKAVTVVHLFGQSADLDPILSSCRRYEIPVLEDAANALGSRYKGAPVGTIGAVGVYSLGGNKIITATAGGVLVTRNREWAEKARFWSTQARDPDPDGVNNYIHSELGYNYRISNVLAGIGLAQLAVLEDRVARRRAVFNRYQDAFADLPGLQPQPEAKYEAASLTEGRMSCHTRWLSCFLVDEAEFGASSTALIRFLEAANIEARPVWKPMHTQPLYQSYERIGGEVAEDLHRRGICLPSSSCLTDAEQGRVIERVRDAHARARNSSIDQPIE